MNKIDFVILWVDGNDPKWIEEKNKYDSKKIDNANAVNRFRDWDNLKYWFRGVEKYASWVNKIYFITYGQIPQWLNMNNPKLKIIHHDDYIPKEYLPTFNSNVIELNLNNIKDLSEYFVEFNDDMFITDYVEPTDFFKNGLPCDECVQNIITSYGRREQIQHTMLNNIDIINRNFNKKEVISKNCYKFFNVRYGFRNLRSIFLLPWYAFTGFYVPHIPISHLKSTFEKVCEIEENAIMQTCKNRFRGYNDISHWLMREWNLCSGKFYPRKSKFGKYFDASNENSEICNYILKNKAKVICINDSSLDFNFEKAKKEINTAFEKALPDKSAFEK